MMETTKQLNSKKTATKLTDEKKAMKAKILADIALKPSANAAAIITRYGKPFGEQSVNAIMDALNIMFAEVNKGDTKQSEAMLMGQAFALQSIFMNLSRQANTEQHMNHLETFLKLALKAQSQCRATLETLAAIKNPPVVFAKQANISSGHQQINNGIPTPATHTGEIKNQPNELLEAQNGSTIMDTRTTGATITENKAMATVD